MCGKTSNLGLCNLPKQLQEKKPQEWGMYMLFSKDQVGLSLQCYLLDDLLIVYITSKVKPQSLQYQQSKLFCWGMLESIGEHSLLPSVISCSQKGTVLRFRASFLFFPNASITMDNSTSTEIAFIITCSLKLEL